jgi:hypothetical protein
MQIFICFSSEFLSGHLGREISTATAQNLLRFVMSDGVNYREREGEREGERGRERGESSRARELLACIFANGARCVHVDQNPN